MNRELYKRYPCPARGCLDLTIKMDGIFWELYSSENHRTNGTKRVHKFQHPNHPSREVEVTPRSPNSRWYKQWD